jgi:hypothetical protein
VVVALLAVFFIMGSSEIYIDGAPTPTEQIVLTVIALVVPLAVLAGWTVSGCIATARSPSSRSLR